MEKKTIHKIFIVYFSGTDGTKRIAHTCESLLLKKNYSVIKHPIDRSMKINISTVLKTIDLLILLFPVHAFDAPLPIKKWIETLPYVNNIDASVISVSGGGEASFNKASRIKSIEALEKKGFTVFYEHMMIMPSNWVVPTHDHAAIRLLRSIPKKAETIINEILSGKIKRSKVTFPTRFIASIISQLEKFGSSRFGSGLCISETCARCMWCVKHCPQGNISLIENTMRFGTECVMCFCCIYGCPSQSIYTTRGKFMVLKNGYSLSELEKRMKHVELHPLEVCAKGFLWKSVKKYLE